MTLKKSLTVFLVILMFGMLGGCGSASTTEPPDVAAEETHQTTDDVTRQQQESRDAIQRCEAPRPEVCASIYAPVCATRSDGSKITHSNGCKACADPQVVSFVARACAT